MTYLKTDKRYRRLYSEWVTARDQVIQSYNNPPLSLEKEESPRIDRIQFMVFINTLWFYEETWRGFAYTNVDTLRKTRELITSLPPEWHNRIDYTPLLTLLDKWIYEETHIELPILVLTIILVWIIPILLLFWFIKEVVEDLNEMKR